MLLQLYINTPTPSVIVITSRSKDALYTRKGYVKGPIETNLLAVRSKETLDREGRGDG